MMMAMMGQAGDDAPALYTLEVTTSAFRINNQGYLVVHEPNLDRDPPNPSTYTFQVRPLFSLLILPHISFLIFPNDQTLHPHLPFHHLF